MKRCFVLLLALALLTGAARAETVPTFGALTGFDDFQKSLTEGARIASVYYTDGFGFSDSEFTTADPDVIQALLDALAQMEVVGPANEAITDWYPQIVFTLEDGSFYRVNFNKQWLMIDGMDNYVLENDGPFWALTSSLVERSEGA